MTIGANYPTPVYVNGYQCNNCAQVAEAKKDINPADPKAGPGGVDAKSGAAQGSDRGAAVSFGGSLAAGSPGGAATTSPAQGATTSQASPASLPQGQGALLDMSA